MKKIILLLLSCLLTGMTHANETAWVSVKQSIVRDSPSFLAGVVARVGYEQPLTVIDNSKTWWQVGVNNETGWIHQSAVSSSLRTSQSAIESFKSDETSNMNQQANNMQSDEITLAGKGFNKATEEEYAKGNSSLNYDQVNIMENRSLDNFSASLFAIEGGLTYVDPASLNQQPTVEKNQSDNDNNPLDLF